MFGKLQQRQEDERIIRTYCELRTLFKQLTDKIAETVKAEKVYMGIEVFDTSPALLLLYFDKVLVDVGFSVVKDVGTAQHLGKVSFSATAEVEVSYYFDKVGKLFFEDGTALSCDLLDYQSLNTMLVSLSQGLIHSKAVIQTVNIHG